MLLPQYFTATDADRLLRVPAHEQHLFTQFYVIPGEHRDVIDEDSEKEHISIRQGW